MRRLLPLAGVLAAALTASAQTKDVSWKKTVLDTKFRSEGVAVADVNKDGKKDVLNGEYWYEAPDWKPHELQPFKDHGTGLGNYSRVFACWAEDLNADGFDDLIVIDFPGAPCYWMENPQGRPGHWRKHQIWHSACNETPAYADLLGTGKRVLVMGFQPPGKETRARRRFPRRGPSTEIEARILRTRSQGASTAPSPVGRVTRTPSSPRSEGTPRTASRRRIISTSESRGTPRIRQGSSVSRVAARIGSAAFLAPEMRTSPSRATPPRMESLSTGSAPAAGGELRRRRGVEGQGVDLSAHRRAERAVDELVALERAQALELRGDDRRLEVHVVVGAHVDARARQCRLDPAPDLLCVH